MMKRLTVTEAAERLKISEDAVRKRMQRGTLARGKGPDGRVYVYLDAEKTSEEDPGTEYSDGGDQNEQRSWWDYVVGVSGLAVLFGGLTYALGLFALWVPIARTHTHDLSTAWHATLWVPRAIVAGLGVSQLVAFPLIAALLILGWIVVSRRYLFAKLNESILTIMLGVGPPSLAVALYAGWRLATGSGPLSQAPFRTIGVSMFETFITLLFLLLLLSELRDRAYKKAAVTVGILLAYCLFNYLLWSQVLRASAQSLQTRSAVIGALIDTAIVEVAIILVFLGAFVASAFFEPQPSQGDNGQEMSGVFDVVIIVTALTFIAAFLLTIPSDPPLPRVDIDVKDKDKDAVGTLLTHTEGFWYVFEQQGNEPGSKLTIIPDDEVKTAWVSKVTE
jgi:hypothetical protein